MALNLHNYGSGRNPWGNLKPEYLDKVLYICAWDDICCLSVLLIGFNNAYTFTCCIFPVIIVYSCICVFFILHWLKRCFSIHVFCFSRFKCFMLEVAYWMDVERICCLSDLLFLYCLSLLQRCFSIHVLSFSRFKCLMLEVAYLMDAERICCLSDLLFLYCLVFVTLNSKYGQ